MPIITHAGEALIAENAANSQGFTIDSMLFAYYPSLDHTADIDRNQGMPSSSNIKHTATNITAGYVNTSEVVYSVVLDSTVGDFDFNWIGLLSDTTLVAVSTIPTFTKTATAGSLTGNSIVRNFALRFSGAKSLTNVTVPAATWQQDYTTVLDSKLAAYPTQSDLNNGGYLGWGTTKTDVMSSRSVVTNYINTKSEIMRIVIAVTASSQPYFIIDDIGTAMVRDGNSNFYHYRGEVLPSEHYRLNSLGNPSITRWLEWIKS